MPTINSYTDENGYYIRARTSDAGNITYKIKDEGNSVVWKHGLRDGDEIAWSTIQSFKSLGIIYTEKSGTLGPDDFKPDPEQLKKTELAESEAQELFSILNSQFNLTKEERAEIRSILGLPPEIDFEEIGERIKSNLENHIDTEGIATRGDGEIEDPDQIDISAWVEEKSKEDHTVWNLHILFISDASEGSKFTEHCIHLCESHGLEHWHVNVLVEPTWDIKQTAIEQKAIIFPYLLEELRSVGFDLGDPSEVLSPPVDLSKSSTES